MDKKPCLSLALQGGGVLGAFTWGVLDGLLENRVEFDLVTGASAGAINAALLASGLCYSYDSAREKLDCFWNSMAQEELPLMVQNSTAGFSKILNFGYQSPSPYYANPLGINPLRERLLSIIDFDVLADKMPLRLLISATNVSDGRARLFRENEIGIDVLLASSCLPAIHHAIEIDGEHYWDGGFSSNPPFYRAAIETGVSDLLLVEIMPEKWNGTPVMSGDITKRVSQIAFSTALHQEKQALSEMVKMCEPIARFGGLPEKISNLKVHSIKAEQYFPDIAGMSALIPNSQNIKRLKNAGKKCANDWLQNSRFEDEELPLRLTI